MRWGVTAYNRLLNRFMASWLSDASSLGGLPMYGFVLLASLASGNTGLFVRLVAAFCIGLFAAYALRVIFPKPRPGVSAAAFGAMQWYEKLDASSFPSVHALRVSILFFSFYGAYPSKGSFAVALLAIAAVSYSRIFLKKHYFVDVAAGAALGILSGLLSLRLQWLPV